jgi:hemoglobin-like flavoprotein
MSGLNVEILKNTLERAKQENGGIRTLGLRFYERLFEVYPSVKSLFHTPPEEQHQKLMASLGAIVAGVTNLERTIPYLRAMAIRHLKYGVENAHYPAVTENLIAVLAEHLSVEGEWPEAYATAWNEAMAVITTVMMEAASNPQQYAEELMANGYQPDGFKANSDKPWVIEPEATQI